MLGTVSLPKNGGRSTWIEKFTLQVGITLLNTATHDNATHWDIHYCTTCGPGDQWASILSRSVHWARPWLATLLRYFAYPDKTTSGVLKTIPQLFSGSVAAMQGLVPKITMNTSANKGTSISRSSLAAGTRFACCSARVGRITLSFFFTLGYSDNYAQNSTD